MQILLASLRRGSGAGGEGANVSWLFTPSAERIDMKHDNRPASPAGRQAGPGRELAYVDETGHARLRQSVVAFIDILGFSQSIRTTAEKPDSQLLVDRILAAMNDSRQYVRQSFPET